MLLILSAKVQLVGCTFAPPFLLPAVTPLLLGVSWGVLAELARLVGPRVYVEFPRPRTRIELGGVGGTRAKEHQNPHFLIQGVVKGKASKSRFWVWEGLP